MYPSKSGNHTQVTLIEPSINCSRLDVKQRFGRVKGKFKGKKNTKGIKTNNKTIKTAIKHYLNTSERESLQGNDWYLRSAVDNLD